MLTKKYRLILAALRGAEKPLTTGEIVAREPRLNSISVAQVIRFENRGEIEVITPRHGQKLYRLTLEGKND